MTKIDFDYICNRCHKPVFDVIDDDFNDDHDCHAMYGEDGCEHPSHEGQEVRYI